MIEDADGMAESLSRTALAGHPVDDGPELAGQLKKVGTSLQVDQWLLALALPRTDAWFLHDRP